MTPRAAAMRHLCRVVLEIVAVFGLVASYAAALWLILGEANR